MIAMEKTFCTCSDFGASGADFASIMGINFNDINAIQSSLVFDEVLQLEEAPAIEPEVESSSFFHAPYPSKVFHDNFISSIAAGYYCFADVVVNPSLKTFLP